MNEFMQHQFRLLWVVQQTFIYRTQIIKYLRIHLTIFYFTIHFFTIHFLLPTYLYLIEGNVFFRFFFLIYLGIPNNIYDKKKKKSKQLVCNYHMI